MPFPDEEDPAGVEVVQAQPDWAPEGADWCTEINALIGTMASDVDHIGSTAVPGLAAKDCIDIMVRTPQLEEPALSSALAAGGYRLRPEPWNRQDTTWDVAYPKLVYAPPAGGRRRNIHVRLENGPNARYALLFRDFLRFDHITRDAWGRFKIRLAMTATALSDYGQIKEPATDILMLLAESWAIRSGWQVPTSARPTS